MTVSIVTTPTLDDAGVSLQGDIDLVKVALLYADKVELISMSASMIGSVTAVADGGIDGLLALMASLDNGSIRHLAGGTDLPDGWRELLPVMVGLAGTPIGEEIGLPRFDEDLAGVQAQLSEVAEDLVEKSGASELIPCLEDGTLELSDAGLTESGDFDDVLPKWTALLGQRLRDPRTKLLFDAGAGDLVGAMLREGIIDSNDLGLRRAGQAAVGAGLVARLPAFPSAPMDELLDLRRDLDDPLRRYRAAVYRLARDVRTIGADAEDRVQMIWEGEVAPTVTEIRDLMAQHGLVREIARAASQDVKTALTAAGVFVGFSGTDLQSGLVASTAAGAQAAATGAFGAKDGRRQVQRQELFYLYEVDRRLGA